MKKFENDSLMQEDRKVDKNDELRNRRLDQNEICAFLFLISIITSLSIIFTIIDECRFRMHLMTCKEIFHLYEKNRKRFSDRENQKLDEKDELRNRKLDQNDESRNRELDQNEVCALFSFDKSLLYDHHSVSFLYEFDDMQNFFFICMKKFENDLSNDDLND
jgi:hypothetical protein